MPNIKTLMLLTIVVAVRKAYRKPGSVLFVVQTGTTLPPEATIIYLGHALLHSSSDQPRHTSG
ncbi:hypothetical protein ABIE27_000519 [Paenibacillus sp. 4624]